MDRVSKLTVLILAVFVLLVVGLSTPVSAASKVDICHFPPGNPSNFHTITVSEKAVDAHIANHDDFLGPCCDIDDICDDDNACTANFCLDETCTSEPVDCNDSVSCTIDACDAVDGCSNTPDDSLCAEGETCDSVDGCVRSCDGGSCVFVSSAPYTGNLGGLSGADTKCQGLANTAGLGGTYKAWLSTSTVDAKDRITDATYIRTCPDGATIASSLADLTDSTLQASILCDESGSISPSNSGAPSGLAWTSTFPDGTSDGVNCNDWISASDAIIGILGLPIFTSARWTRHTSRSCSEAHSLYCFEQ